LNKIPRGMKHLQSETSSTPSPPPLSPDYKYANGDLVGDSDFSNDRARCKTPPRDAWAWMPSTTPPTECYSANPVGRRAAAQWRGSNPTPSVRWRTPSPEQIYTTRAGRHYASLAMAVPFPNQSLSLALGFPCASPCTSPTSAMISAAAAMEAISSPLRSSKDAEPVSDQIQGPGDLSLEHQDSQAYIEQVFCQAEDPRGQGAIAGFCDRDLEPFEEKKETLLSLGSEGHPNRCAAPCKYHWKKRGCKDGALCTRCHVCVWKPGCRPVEPFVGNERKEKR